jgi:CheY-like chemotaxis protein
LVIVDLTTPNLDIRDAVQRLRAASPAPAAILAFAPHVQADRLRAAVQAGCDQVLTRGQFSREMSSWLARHLD